eukprot:scpid93520/ scgid18032/ 
MYDVIHTIPAAMPLPLPCTCAVADKPCLSKHEHGVLHLAHVTCSPPKHVLYLCIDHFSDLLSSKGHIWILPSSAGLDLIAYQSILCRGETIIPRTRVLARF